jgi:hypothetical protein
MEVQMKFIVDLLKKLGKRNSIIIGVIVVLALGYCVYKGFHRTSVPEVKEQVTISKVLTMEAIGNSTKITAVATPEKK